MMDRTANLLGVVSLAIADRIAASAQHILNHAGETAAAVVVVGYGFGPSNDRLRRILGLSHPGTVRLVDRLVVDGLVERREGQDRRSVALHLTDEGMVQREQLLQGRLAAIRPLLEPLTGSEQAALGDLLHKLLAGMNPEDGERETLCRLCDGRVCDPCPIPASFRGCTAGNVTAPPAATTPP